MSLFQLQIATVVEHPMWPRQAAAAIKANDTEVIDGNGRPSGLLGVRHACGEQNEYGGDSGWDGPHLTFASG